MKAGRVRYTRVQPSSCRVHQWDDASFVLAMRAASVAGMASLNAQGACARGGGQ